MLDVVVLLIFLTQFSCHVLEFIFIVFGKHNSTNILQNPYTETVSVNPVDVFEKKKTTWKPWLPSALTDHC